MRQEKNKKWKTIGIPLLYIIFVSAAILIVQAFFFSPMRVMGNSMNPALQNRDVLLINKQAYRSDNPKRFDLIVFPYQYDNQVEYIKRVIGLPGETVEIRNNTIYINGQELKEYYGYYDKNEKQLGDFEAYTLSTDEYFVLGDNREHSVDSRSGDVGMVKKDEIVGRAVFRVWPISSVGSLKYQ